MSLVANLYVSRNLRSGLLKNVSVSSTKLHVEYFLSVIFLKLILLDNHTYFRNNARTLLYKFKEEKAWFLSHKEEWVKAIKKGMASELGLANHFQYNCLWDNILGRILHQTNMYLIYKMFNNSFFLMI